MWAVIIPECPLTSFTAAKVKRDQSYLWISWYLSVSNAMISYLANKKATGIVKKGHDKNFDSPFSAPLELLFWLVGLLSKMGEKVELRNLLQAIPVSTGDWISCLSNFGAKFQVHVATGLHLQKSFSFDAIFFLFRKYGEYTKMFYSAKIKLFENWW